MLDFIPHVPAEVSWALEVTPLFVPETADPILAVHVFVDGSSLGQSGHSLAIEVPNQCQAGWGLVVLAEHADFKYSSIGFATSNLFPPDHPNNVGERLGDAASAEAV